jgi:hypothetical protein
MDQAKQDILQKLKDFNNILVTVSRNPSVDQLAACIGLTLLLNKLDKHATAVFSGDIPDTIDFLKPEDTIEKNTNSLRDFIIALDKSKADKLRYKVEDKVVKIFITPYRTSLSEEDLNFSQGDFNIDVVMALGVRQQSDLDDAITAHGRILHDATVVAVSNTEAGELGTINWVKKDASSLSELVAELAHAFDKPLLDSQISTALLTGIVAETDRFRNEKTTAETMSISSELMKAGANQQLVAEELEHEIDVHADEKPPKAEESQDKQPDERKQDEEPSKPDDGTLEIDHEIDTVKENRQGPVLEESSPQPELEDTPTLPEPEVPSEHEEKHEEPKPTQPGSRPLITEEPRLGGQLTANTRAEDAPLASSVDPAIIDTNVDKSQPLLNHDALKTKEPRIEPLKPAGQDTPGPGGDDSPVFAKAVPVPAPTPHFEPPKSTIPPAPSTPKPFTPSPVPPAPAPPAPQPAPAPAPTPFPPAPEAPKPFEPPKQPEPPRPETLTEREEPTHPSEPPAPAIDDIEKAREEVLKAINESPSESLPPVQALNAQPLGENLHEEPPVSGGGQLITPAGPSPAEPAPGAGPAGSAPADQPLTMPLPPSIPIPPPQAAPPTNAPNASPNSPPPVPPPMMPPASQR